MTFECFEQNDISKWHIAPLSQLDTQDTTSVTYGSTKNGGNLHVLFINCVKCDLKYLVYFQNVESQIQSRWACVGWKHGCDFKQMKLFRGADRGVFLKLKVLMITDARLEITQFSEIMTPQFIRGKTNANEGRKTSVIMMRMVSWGRSCRGERRKHRS